MEKNYLNKNLITHLINYKKKNIYPFHMPGHKMNREFFSDINFLDLDYTEFNSMDNLHNPKGIILNSEKKASEIFGAKKSFFLVNGTTSGIISSILSICNLNDKIIIGRNSHKSIYSGLEISGATPIYVYPENLSNGLVGGINPKKIEEAILNNLDCKGILITSPTYEGFCSNLKEISKITNKYNKILIVDDAHGAHFNFSDYFPETSTKYADISIQSLHKTLPVLGQSSILHVNSNKINLEKLKKSLSLIQTTSPSYLLMGIMDYTINKLYNNKKYFLDYTNLLIEFRDKFKIFKNIQLINNFDYNDSKIFEIDKSKLTFFINSNLSGTDLEKILRDKYKIQIELSGINHIICLTSPCDTKEGFEKLFNAIKKIDKEISYKEIIYKKNNFNKPIVKYNFKNINLIKQKKILLEKSENYISGEQIIPYPPGIPILNPGEIITAEILKEIKNYINNNINIIGLADENLKYIYVLENKK